MSNVIINDVSPRSQFTATSLQTVFDTGWTADAITDVVVYARATGVAADDSTQVIAGSNYTVTLEGATEIVRVTFSVGRVLNDIVTIVRATPMDRQNLYINTNFTPSMLNGDFGRMVLTQQQNQLDRGASNGVGVRYNYSENITHPKDQILPILPANSLWFKDAGDTAITTILARDALSAPYDSSFYIATADAVLPNAKDLGLLPSGILKHLVTAGDSEPATAIPHSDYGVEDSPTTTGSSNAYLVAVDSRVVMYHTGMRITAVIHSSNTGASTINVNGIGLKNIKLPDGTDPAANDLLLNAVEIMVYDGTSFQLITPQATGPSGSLSNALTDGDLFVGNGSNIATGVTMSGDATMVSSGAMTIANDAVTLAKLAGGTAGATTCFDASGDPAEVAPGASGFVLTSGGAGVAPSMQANSAAPVASSYITETDETGTLTGSFPMSSLATGITKNTTTTGVQSIAIEHTDYGLAASGVLTGAEMTVNGGDNTKFDVAAGTGVVINDTDPANPAVTAVTIAASTLNSVTSLATAIISHVLVDSAGSLVQQLSFPTPTQLRTHIYLGILGHPDKTTLIGAIDSNTVAYDEGNLARDVFDAIGPMNRSGHTLSANGSNLKFDRAAGTSVLFGRNRINSDLNPNVTTDALDTDVTFLYLYQNGSGDWTSQVGATALVPGKYDDASGTLANVGNNQWTNQRQYYSPYPGGTDIHVVYYGQTVYGSQSDAIEAINSETFTESEASLNGAVFLGWVTMKGNASNLSVSSQAIFSQAGLFRSAGSGGGSVALVAEASRVAVDCLKSTAGTITAGQGVYINGFDATNTVPTIELARSDASGTMPAFGVAEETITDSTVGHVVIMGNVPSIDTSAFSDAQTIYVDPTTAGDFTSTKPIGPNLVQSIGKVTYAHATSGEIEVLGAGRSNDLPNIANTKIWIGDANGVPQEFALSSDVTMTAGGVVTVADNAISLAKMAHGTDGELITYDATGAPANVATGSAGEILTSNGVGAAPTFQASASGGKSSYDVNQTTHGLVVNNVIKYDGSTTYSKATADSAANAEVVGIVTAVADVDNFTVQTGGRVTTLTGLTDDLVYFLSPTTAGLLTSTEPTTDGQVSRPVLISTSTTAGVILPYRGIEINSGDVSGAGAESIAVVGSGTQTLTTSVKTKIQLSSKIFDVAGTFDATTNYRWTPQTAGKYTVTGQIGYSSAGDGTALYVYVYKNGVEYLTGSLVANGANLSTTIIQGTTIVDMNGTTDYIEIFGRHQKGSNADVNLSVSNIFGSLLNTTSSNPERVLLATKTASSSPTIEFTTGIDATYDEYEIRFIAVKPATDGVNFEGQTSTDGGATYDGGASAYRWMVGGRYGTTSLDSTSTGDTKMALNGSARTIGSGTGEDFNGSIVITNPSAATWTNIAGTVFFTGTGGNEIASALFHGRREAAADVDAIQFSFSSGNIASGTFKLYGIN